MRRSGGPRRSGLLNRTSRNSSRKSTRGMVYRSPALPSFTHCPWKTPINSGWRSGISAKCYPRIAGKGRLSATSECAKRDWFPEARLNLARNLLRRNDDADAIIGLQEGGERRVLSFRGLYDLVSLYSQAMRHAGVGVGDCVAGFMPNVPEAVAALLAAASVGAVWACCSPEFGVGAAVDRLGQVQPKLLFAGDGYRYGGKSFDVLGKVAEIAAKIPSIETTVIVPVLNRRPAINQIGRAVLSDEFTAPFLSGEIRFESLPFDHPVFILFSSGTTGAPKCIIHSAGGALLETLKAQALHFDVKWDDRYFCWTPTGWVTWNSAPVHARSRRFDRNL